MTPQERYAILMLQHECKQAIHRLVQFASYDFLKNYEAIKAFKEYDEEKLRMEFSLFERAEILLLGNFRADVYRDILHLELYPDENYCMPRNKTPKEQRIYYTQTKNGQTVRINGYFENSRFVALGCKLFNVKEGRVTLPLTEENVKRFRLRDTFEINVEAGTISCIDSIYEEVV